jgi:hypothetical protein
MEILFGAHSLSASLSWLAGLSLGTFFLSLLLIPYIVGKLAPDCFVKLSGKAERPRPPLTVGALILLVSRNIIGLALLLAGMAMLVLPGQGILTILLGVVLLSFPGKLALLTWLIFLPGVRHSLDWLRQKRRKQPFIWPENPRHFSEDGTPRLP